jgi:hypothetical protein
MPIGIPQVGPLQWGRITVGGGSAGANTDNTEIGITFWGDYA